MEPFGEKRASRDPEAPVEVLDEDHDLFRGVRGSGLGAGEAHQYLGSRGQQSMVTKRLDVPLVDVAAQPGSL